MKHALVEIRRALQVIFVERRVPTVVRHFPMRAKSKIYELYLEKVTPLPKGKIHLIYFSCGKHYKLLRVSLRSLERVNNSRLGKIYLYIDSNDPLNDGQKRELSNFQMDILVVPTGAIKGWGVGMVSLELSAFEEVCREVSAGDYVAKVDSDIVFVSDNVFEYVLRSKKDLVGDGAFINYKYAQGGMYFLSKNIIPSLANYQGEALKSFMKEELKTRAEDIVITELVRRAGGKVWLTKYLIFPSEMKNKGGIEKIKQRDGTGIHFVHDKEVMVGLWDSLPTLFSAREVR